MIRTFTRRCCPRFTNCHLLMCNCLPMPYNTCIFMVSGLIEGILSLLLKLVNPRHCINQPIYQCIGRTVVTLLPNLSSNYIIGSLTPSTRKFSREKLNGQNYSSWSQSIKMFLKDRHQLSFLTGEILHPPPGDSLERF